MKALDNQDFFFSNLKQSFVENIFENLPAVKLYQGTLVKQTNKQNTIFRSYPFKERGGEREKERMSQGDYRI